MTPFDPRLQLIATQARVRPPHVFHVWYAMRAMGKQFHADAFAQFSGLEPKHVLAIIAALTDHDCLPQGRLKVERRATRISDDFAVPTEWIDWACNKRNWPRDQAIEESEIFVSYWIAKPGEGKLDWFATWQNWVRRSNRADGMKPGNDDAVNYPRLIAHLEREIAKREKGWPADDPELLGMRWRLNSYRERSNVIPINRAVK